MPKKEIKLRAAAKSVSKPKKSPKIPKSARRLTAEGWKRKLYIQQQIKAPKKKSK